MSTFGGIYERSPWVADQVWRQGLSEREDSLEGLSQAMRDAVDASTPETQLSLIRTHPDLAGKAAVRGELTSESNVEQASAGIDQCTEEEFERFQKYNATYRERFGFPFVMAVRGSNRESILTAFERRLENDYETEFRQALREIHKIAMLRLRAVAEFG